MLNGTASCLEKADMNDSNFVQDCEYELELNSHSELMLAWRYGIKGTVNNGKSVVKGYFKKIQDIKYNLDKKINARMIDLTQAHVAVKENFQKEVLRLSMMDDVITRVIELIEEDDRYKLLK